MNSKAEVQTPAADIAKLVLSVAVLVAAVAAFYYFAEQSTLLRVVGLLGATAIAAVIALQTDKGRQVSGFFKSANVEVRKVVWPTRQETVQTTLIVIGMVLVVAVFLWLLDMFLGWAVQFVIGTGA